MQNVLVVQVAQGMCKINVVINALQYHICIVLAGSLHNMDDYRMDAQH